jgi:hypothetical protein
MILNPPKVTLLLRAWHKGLLHAEGLAKCLPATFGPLSWEDFLRAYHLYLQSIPFELARESWGLTQTATSHTPPTS